MTAPARGPHPQQAHQGPREGALLRRRRALLRRRRVLLRRRRAAALGLVAALGLSVVAVTQGGLPVPWQEAGGRDTAVAAPDTTGVDDASHPTRRDAGRAAAAAPPPEVRGEPCRPEPGGGRIAAGGAVLGGAALGGSALGCASPAWQALPATALERTDPEMLLAQVTREQPVDPLEYAPDDLVPVRGGFYELRAEVADQLEALLLASEEAGHPYLVVTSGFRSYQTQAGTFEDWVNRLGVARAEMLSARPGHSEHQLGLAVDLGGSCHYQCFGTAPDGQWVAANAHRWGFIVRYPEGGEAVTGYAWEPWHLRYVGPRAAWGMHLAGEPYWEHFQPVAAEAAGLD